MTTALQILIAWPIASVITGLIVGPAIRAGMHPRRGQGDQERASDVRGEGLFLTNHNEGINS